MTHHTPEGLPPSDQHPESALKNSGLLMWQAYCDMKAENEELREQIEALRAQPANPRDTEFGREAEKLADDYLELNRKYTELLSAQAAGVVPVAYMAWRGAFRVSPHGQDAEGNEWLELVDGPDVKGAFPVYASAPPAHVPADVEAWRHVANEWADMATSCLQWLRNIRDGISSADTAIANTLTMLAHCKAVTEAAPKVAQHPAPEPAQAVDAADLPEKRLHGLAVEAGLCEEGDYLSPKLLKFARAALAARQPQAQQGGGEVAAVWRDAANWIRNNYQDHPNIASLCDAMCEAGQKGNS